MANARHEILVACLVESSVALLHEWNEILLTYISPLLQRIATAGAATGSRNDLRIGFVSYSDSYVHPNPILARRFFSPIPQLPKELNEDPSSLGIGRTASGGEKGMAILEGYTAVLEMFDASSETRTPLRPHSTNEASPEISDHNTTFYLIHVASSPPDNSIRPFCNTNPALDEVTWASLPSEILKRKIRSSMILTRPVPELLELHRHISHTPDPSWINLIKPSHRLLFSGLPPKDTTKIVPQKRPASESTENAQQPAQSRPPPLPEQVVNVNPPPVASITAITATPTPSIGTNNPSLSRQEGVVTRPVNEPQLPPQLQPQPPQLQPPTQPQFPPNAQSHPQPHQPQSQPRLQAAVGVDLQKLVQYMKSTDNDCRGKAAALSDARKSSKPQAEIDSLELELKQKLALRAKLLAAYQQVVQKRQPNGAVAPSQPGTVLNTQPVASGSKQPPRQTQEQPEAQMTSPNTGLPGQGLQFPIFLGPNLGNKNPFQNLPTSTRAGMEAQMQKMLAERTRPPVLAAAPQTQLQPSIPAPNTLEPTQGTLNMPTTQASDPNPTPNPNISNNNNNIAMTPRPSIGTNPWRWEGGLSWPSSSGGVRKDNQIYIALFSQDNNLHCESWPQRLILQPSRSSFNIGNIQSCVKEFNPSMALIRSAPIVGNAEATAQNARSFRQLKEIIQQKNLLAFCRFNIAGGPAGTGLVTFPMNPSSSPGDLLVALIFRRSAIPPVLTGPSPSTQVLPVPPTSTEVPPALQPVNAGVAGQVPIQNMPPDAKTFLQQRQAAALAAYSQQQLVQQAHQHGLVTNPGQGAGASFNVAQFLHGLQSVQQPPDGGNQMGLGELSLPQAPALQQVQHPEPLGFNSGQINTFQMLQYRRPDDGQAQ